VAIIPDVGEPQKVGFDQVTILSDVPYVVVSALHPLATDDADWRTFSHEIYFWVSSQRSEMKRGAVLQRGDTRKALAHAEQRLLDLGLSPFAVVVEPSFEQACLDIEMRRGVTICGSTSRMLHNQKYRGYPISGVRNRIVCMRHRANENPNVDRLFTHLFALEKEIESA